MSGVPTVSFRWCYCRICCYGHAWCLVEVAEMDPHCVSLRNRILVTPSTRLVFEYECSLTDSRGNLLPPSRYRLVLLSPRPHNPKWIPSPSFRYNRNPLNLLKYFSSLLIFSGSYCYSVRWRTRISRSGKMEVRRYQIESLGCGEIKPWFDDLISLWLAKLRISPMLTAQVIMWFLDGSST